MHQDSLIRFLKKVAEDDALFQEFAALAAKHGFDFSELGDTELDQVAGGSLAPDDYKEYSDAIRAAKETKKMALRNLVQYAEMKQQATRHLGS